MITPTEILLVALGGAIGAVLRFSVGQFIDSSQFPWATFTVNIIGSFMMAFIMFAYTGMSLETRLFLFTGLIGAFTTMSTFTLDTVGLFFDGRAWQAGLNVILNAGLCVVGAAIGRYAGIFVAGI